MSSLEGDLNLIIFTHQWATHTMYIYACLDNKLRIWTQINPRNLGHSINFKFKSNVYFRWQIGFILFSRIYVTFFPRPRPNTSAPQVRFQLLVTMAANLSKNFHFKWNISQHSSVQIHHLRWQRSGWMDLLRCCAERGGGGNPGTEEV